MKVCERAKWAYLDTDNANMSTETILGCYVTALDFNIRIRNYLKRNPQHLQITDSV